MAIPQPTFPKSNQSLRQINKELFSLQPSALISLFIIDLSDIAFDLGIINNKNVNIDPNSYTFRFHNNIKLLNSSIFFQGFEYIAAPIQAIGFETNAKGTLPIPKLSISADNQSVPALSLLRSELLQLGDLTGAKVIRKRTFAKFLDANNYLNLIVPDDFSPDPTQEFPPDIYFIDRKSNETKLFIEFELSSPLDFQGVKIPFRLVFSNRCPWSYRGEGCLYEYANRRTVIHGDSTQSTLPVSATPVANFNDEKISDILLSLNGNIPVMIVDKGLWQIGKPYLMGHAVHIIKNNVRYYFVCKQNNPSVNPPDPSAWIPDSCSKLISGCKLRFGVNGSAQGNIVKGNLPFGGFPGVTRVFNV